MAVVDKIEKYLLESKALGDIKGFKTLNDDEMKLLISILASSG